MAAGSRRRVYVRGSGIRCALGDGREQVSAACRDGGRAPSLRDSVHTASAGAPYCGFASTEIQGAESSLYDHLQFSVTQALADAQLSAAERSATAVFCGSTACDISDFERRYRADLLVDGTCLPQYSVGFGVLAGHVKDHFVLGGEEFSFNTACTSSANALLVAARMIAAGVYEHAVVLGVEIFNRLSFEGFHAMMLLSPDACRPFDAARNGTVLGEAVGAVVLSCRPGPAADGGQPFRVLGGANTCDTGSITSANATAIRRVLEQALADAGLDRRAVTLIKAHGTGTDNNDQAEGAAMRALYADAPLPPFTSLKPYLGHTLGACGVVELITLLACIRSGFVPGVPTFASMDADIMLAPLREHLAFGDGILMLNYFGFGGNNSSILLGNGN